MSIHAADGSRLEAWFVRRSERPIGRCVIVLHGIGDSRAGPARIADMFLAEDYSVLLPDSRAHGRSEGAFVTYGALEKYDLVAWAEWSLRNGCRDVYGLGESLGAAILIQAAAVKPIFRAIVAECSYADLSSIAEYRLGQMVPLPRWLAFIPERMIIHGAIWYARLRYGIEFQTASPVLAIGQIRTPVLLVHGMADNQTPFSHSERLARANPNAALWLVPHAGHTGACATDPAEFRSRVLGWFTLARTRKISYTG